MQHLRHHQRRRDPRIPAPHPLLVEQVPKAQFLQPRQTDPLPAHRAGVVVLQRIEVHRRHRPLPTPSLRLLRPQAHGAQPAHQILGRRLDVRGHRQHRPSARQQHLGHQSHIPPLLLRNRIVHAQVQQGLLADLVADSYRAGQAVTVRGFTALGVGLGGADIHGGAAGEDWGDAGRGRRRCQDPKRLLPKKLALHASPRPATPPPAHREPVPGPFSGSNGHFGPTLARLWPGSTLLQLWQTLRSSKSGELG